MAASLKKDEFGLCKNCLCILPDCKRASFDIRIDKEVICLRSAKSEIICENCKSGRNLLVFILTMSFNLSIEFYII